MRILDVILIASQLALFVCLPQDIRFVQPSRLSLRQVPAESVPVDFSTRGYQRQAVPFGFQRVFPETFFISDQNQNQFTEKSPKLVTVTYPERADGPQVLHRIRDHQGSALTHVSVVPSAPQSEPYGQWRDSQDSAADYVRVVPSVPQSKGSSRWSDGQDSASDYVRVVPSVPQSKGSGQWRDGQDSASDYVRVVPSVPQTQRIVQPNRSSGHRDGIVLDGAFYLHPDRENEVVDQQHRYVTIPSEDNLELNKKQEQHLQNPQIFIFRNSDLQPEFSQRGNDEHLYSGTSVQGILSHANHGNHPPLGVQIYGQTMDSSVQSPTDRLQYPIAESLPIERKPVLTEQGFKGSAEVPHSSGALVTRLTAPSNDPRSSNTVMITKKPCEICCVDNEVKPCKSCCAHTPLLNPKTLKTVVG